MKARAILAGVVVGLALLVAFGYRQATRAPIIRTATFKAPNPPNNGLPVRVLLMSDAHVERPEMPLSRLAQVVEQANALHPDMIVIAGDFVGDSALATKRYTIEQAVAPLRQLKAPLGVFAVPGNNDRRKTELGYALESVGVQLVDDNAVQVGPIALGGFRPGYYRSIRRLHRLQGVKVLVAHSPDQFARIRSKIPLMLAGHTHCGQIVLPVIGAPATGSQYGTRYLCGLIRERGKTLIVTSGLGTSIIPMRIGAPPDMWLITIE